MAECGGSDCLEPQRRVGHWSLYRLFLFFFFSNGRVREGGGRRGCQGVQLVVDRRRKTEAGCRWTDQLRQPLRWGFRMMELMAEDEG